MMPNSDNAVLPPKRCYRRPRRWDNFEKLYDPIVREHDKPLRELGEDAEARD